MSDVTIPADVARRMADHFRNVEVERRRDGYQGPATLASEWADLLDPRPVSLRDEVADALAHLNVGRREAWVRDADAVLAVVRRRIEALPFDATAADVLLDVFGEAAGE